MQETGYGLRSQAQVLGFGVYGMREVLQFAESLIRVGAQENGAGQQALGAIVYPDEQRQQQAGGYEDDSGIKGALEMLGVYGMREVLQFAESLIRVGAQENGAGQQAL